MKQSNKEPALRTPLPLPRHTSNARLAKFVFKEILEGGSEGTTPPYNLKWHDLEEQSYVVLASLRVFRAYMEAHHQKGLNGDAVNDCLSMLDPLIAFLDAIDLTGLVMKKDLENEAASRKRKAA